MDHYKCLNCGSIGEHNFDSHHDGDFGEALWTEYSESLQCDECGNSEIVSGTIDDLEEIMDIQNWSKFAYVDR